MGKYDDYYEARDIILDIVKSDLLGPVFDDEILNELPISYYLMGKLYPRSDDTEYDENTTSADLDNMDGDVSLSLTNTKEPSAMGITFTVDSCTEQLLADVEYAIYKPYLLDEARESGLKLDKYQEQIDEFEKQSDSRKKPLRFWQRTGFKKRFAFSTNVNCSFEIENGVFLKTFINNVSGNETVITAVLTNERNVEDDMLKKAENAIMQPRIIIKSNDSSYVFREVRRMIGLNNNEELLELDMLYSKKKCYAQGHGCSAVWDFENTQPTFVSTEFMPTYNLNQMKAAEISDNPAFNMQYLFTAEKADVINNLYDFWNRYRDWIESIEQQSKSDEYKDYKESTALNIAKCKNILNRIKESIDILNTNEIAWNSFQYANEAMFMQRYKTIEKDSVTNDVVEIDPNKINWYPFQLAFFLLEIKSIVEPESDDRKIVDLLWFPTGGGKTEAYLGISAFEIFYRRINNPDKCNGVAIIMRYTLRLLTIQQFERASMLICACELLRKKYGLPGDEVSIGLWVGNEFTPGKLKTADAVLTKIKNTGSCDHDDVDPCQVKICPWCGKKLNYNNYNVDMVNKRMTIKCDNDECSFFGVPLPVRLIDEEIYEHKPSFIVATVDKFAQIAIKHNTSALFSYGTNNLPPELIIQDELHLISGPLGTITGLYEAAITNICEERGRPVKVIASTATIRNASKQILGLFGREYNQFPPQGINEDDSFFAVKATPTERPARLYAGIMGVGTTFTTTLIRLYASWLYASRYLINLGYDERVIDNFWTLTGYFNSIRELGATHTQIVDDIQSRYSYLKHGKFSDKYSDFCGNEKYENSVELTSRMPNDEISDVIQKRLKIPYKHGDYSSVYDYVLASNMISVGVDVGRLGTMAVAGQPKTNAEYIQATSRVGRSNPGLVFTVLNSVRSRDRSHYEQFSKYHSAMYKYVEATSLTPFSDRARDRGLQALFVILCRYLCPSISGDSKAGNFNPNDPGVKRAEEIIIKHVSVVDPREVNNVISEIKQIEEKWLEEASHTDDDGLWYRKGGKKSLLKEDIEIDERFRIMNSMRSVETASGIYLIGD